MATTQYIIVNNVNTQLAAAASSTATTLTLASSTNLPTLSTGQVMPLTLNDAATGTFYEIVYVTAISGVTLTVTRAQEGTGALNWSIGDYAYCAPTAGTVATALGNPNNTFQVAAPTSANQAIPAVQAAGVVGSARKLAMTVPAASSTATMTADEIIVETALGGFRYCLSSFSKTINLATTGAGGMDTGSAPTSGYVALYAIYNPTTATSALLATNATSTAAPNIYGGANIPSGYTASALVSVWPTNGSGNFIAGGQRDRSISLIPVSALSTASIVSSLTSFSISGVVPPNTISIGGFMQVAGSGSGLGSINIASSSGGLCMRAHAGYTTNATAPTSSFDSLDLFIPQTIYFQTANGGLTSPTFSVSISRYSF